MACTAASTKPSNSLSMFSYNRLFSLATAAAPASAVTSSTVTALAGQAAVAIENSRLYENIEKLFEGFVLAAVHAIEQRDPTTYGHSGRVAGMTVGLAEIVDRAGDGPY